MWKVIVGGVLFFVLLVLAIKLWKLLLLASLVGLGVWALKKYGATPRQGA